MRHRRSFLLASALACASAAAVLVLPEPASAAVVAAGAGALVLLAARRRRRELAELEKGVERASEGERPRLPEAVSAETEALLVSIGGLADVVARQRKGSETARLLARTVVEQVPAGLLVVDARLRVLDANPAARRLFRAGGRVAGAALVDLVRNPAVVRLFEAGLARRGRDAAAESATVRLDAEVGLERTVEVTVRPLEPGSAPDDPAAVGVVRDVTEQERTEELRRRFVADVSHELRTPLASVRAAAETLAGEEELPETLRRLSEIVLRQSAEMEELVSDLIDLSQIESGSVSLSMEAVTVSSLLADVGRDVARAAAAKDVTVAVEAPTGLSVRGDRRRLSQVFRNLLDNAVKFSPGGARVDVLAEPVGLGPGGGVAVHVVDRGIGISRADQERIFQRFYRADPSRNRGVPGTGLGLAIVKHLLILHGGEVRVDSAPGSGSRFTVILPAAEATAAGATAVAAQEPR
ncbi:MAG: PAS domain-containing protein [Acidobacteria bacterium]|nr:MAG: PAS domain-containing protein [Acidobacteriota bacterium]